MKQKKKNILCTQATNNIYLHVLRFWKKEVYSHMSFNYFWIKSVHFPVDSVENVDPKKDIVKFQHLLYDVNYAVKLKCAYLLVTQI